MRTLFVAIIASLFVNNPLIASAEISAQQKLMARRAAELDAYRLLSEQALGVRVTSATTVKDFAAQSDSIQASLDDLIKGVKFENVRYFDDGSVEVDAALVVRELVETITKTVERDKQAGRLKKDLTVENIDRKDVDTRIEVTGAGVVTVTSEMPDPKDVPVVALNMGSDTKQATFPSIFSAVGAQERLKAKRAAEVDAYRKLLEEIEGLRISADTSVKDFVTESDSVRTSLDSRLKGTKSLGVRYMPNGMVEIQMQVAVPLLITELQTISKSHYKGGRWTEDLFEKIKEHTHKKVIAVVGVGAVNTSSLTANTQNKSGEAALVLLN